MRSRRRREALVAGEPSIRDYRRLLLDSYWFISSLVGAQGNTSRELETLRQQLPARRELAATEQREFLDRYNLAALHTAIGGLLMQTGDSQGALENQREGLRLREEIAAQERGLQVRQDLVDADRQPKKTPRFDKKTLKCG